MPARIIDDDPSIDDHLDEIAAALQTMSPDRLRQFIENLHDPADVDLVERALARVSSIGVRSDPATFANYLTGGEYKLWRYVRAISTRIAEAKRGERSRFQAVNIPSQYGKTTLIGNYTPVWLLDQDPRLRIMYVTYDANKAVEEGGKARDLAEDNAERLNFRLRPDRRARGMWATPEGGGLYCVGVDGGITGWPADVLLLDDLIKGWQAAHSPAQRAHVWAVYRSQIRMRSQGGRTIIIAAGTRWHEADFFAELAKAGDGDPAADQFDFLRLPAIAETHNPADPDPMLREPDPLGREPGQVLEPERFDEQEVLARRAVLGSYLATAIEQQRPAPEEGGEIQRSWWSWSSAFPTRYDDAASSWDMKLKDKETSDFVVGQAWGRTGSSFWCVDQLRGSWSQPVTKVAIALMQIRHPWLKRHYIENTGFGPEVIAELRAPAPGYNLRPETIAALGITTDEIARVEQLLRRGMSGLVPVTVKGSKTVRLRAESGKIEAGDVYLPEGKDWAAGLVDEAAAFPNGTTDDQVDTLSQALSKMSRSKGRVGIPKGTMAKSPVSARPPRLGRR